ncbi:MAG: phosphoribosylaminoimidazolesuccinocarboxamide synthase [Rhodospirillales bacterium]|nr:phosphoribosylaminoimidazolesuccinocarboxamide synthase [Rhodospirillales bacterium]MCB9965594.1 phosphoribosylaminoimidazolesuccinocarboxamide synthase [Rhodospirillales bacterium]MCB9979835.1 phosphoribosylaminoimidazolesuccinocarboxamide synthase [Rhodospirillales bacterium]
MNYVLEDTASFQYPHYYKGKVRDNYDLPDNRRLLITTDRFSAFDQNLTTIPLKGQVLTQTAKFWFEHTKDIIPNHVLSYPDPNVLLCKKVTILPIEVVVRNYLTGTTITSIWPMYKAGTRHMYGHTFPEGMIQNQKLPVPILTPTTKGHGKGGDVPISEQDILAQGIVAPDVWKKVSEAARALFDLGQTMAAKNGLILVDTKYEFGIDAEGNVILADEIHTPDSSRYWFTEDYPQSFAAGTPPKCFDKDFIRRWVVSQCDPYHDAIPAIPDDVRLQTSDMYVQAYEMITGQTFQWPDLNRSVKDRVKAAVSTLF